MENQAKLRRASGWQDAETARLFTAVRQANDEGRPLRAVFEQLSGDLGRKPNSIRNYYYACMRTNPDAAPARIEPSRQFTPEETHDLLRRVLIAKSTGRSVRSCVMEMANGDRSRMLRYQNKYRTLLKHRPDLINAVREELAEEGYSGSDPQSASPAAPIGTPESTAAARLMAQPCVADMLEGIKELIRRAAIADEADERLRTIDRLRVEHDLQRLAWEKDFDEATAHLARCVDHLKEFVAQSPTVRAAELDAFIDRSVALLGESEAFLTRVRG